MKTVFDSGVRNELVERIRLLNENSQRQWGKMTVYQAAKHCRVWEEWIQGGQPARRSLLGLLFGKMALKSVLRDEAPLRRNTPTNSDFKVTELTGPLEAEKARWSELIAAYENFSKPVFMHDFFGPLNKEQIGYLVYKHNDHHLRQFDC